MLADPASPGTGSQLTFALVCALWQAKSALVRPSPEAFLTPSPNDNSTELTRHLLAAARTLGALDPADAKAVALRFNLAKCLQASGASKEALALCTELADALPDRGDIAHLVINLAIDAEDYDTALAAIASNEAHFATATDLLTKKAVALTRAGRDAEALPLLEDLRARAPDHPFALLNLGRIYRRQGAWAKADDAFGTIVAADRTNEGGWLGRINTALAQRDLDSAMDFAQDARAALPNDPQILLIAARVLTMLDRLDDAETLLASARDDWAKAHPGIGVGLAQLRRQKGDFAGADATYAEVLRDDTSHAGAWIGRLQNLLEQGDIDTALAMSDAARASCPDTAPILRLHATILRRAGRDQDAIDVLETLHRSHPEHTGFTLSLAGARRQLGHLDDADRLFADVLSKEPENWIALQGRVGIAEARQDYDAALALLETTPERSHSARDSTAG